MQENIKKAVLGLSKNTDWLLVRDYLLEEIESLLLEKSDTTLTSDEYKIDRLSKEKAYDLLSDLISNLEFKDIRVSNNSQFR
jgi:hypothetical protein